MLSNGVPAERIVLSRLGTHHAPPRVRAEAVPDPPALRGIYVGRLHPSKGVGVLVRAMGALNGAPISVDVYGPSEGEHGFPCDVAAPNVSYRGALPDDEVVNVMAGYDFAAVPTQVPESGPFTVIEALQAGIPVIGSDVPGINELVEHGRNGLLVDPASVSEWTRVLGRLASRPADLRSLRGFARPSRTMSDVAAEMFDVYRQLVASSRGRAASVA
jgi:glycosyltransferase involved in cell wall biosynthesis